MRTVFLRYYFCRTEVNTVGQFSNSEVIKQYIKNQGKNSDYKKLHQGQLNLEL